MAIDQTHPGEKPNKKEIVAKELARKHFEIESGLTHVFRLIGPADVEIKETEPIKLLEVNDATVSSGVMPLYFGPMPGAGIPYPSIIVEVTSAEFEQIKTEELKLPRGWTIGEQLPNPALKEVGAA